LNEYDYIKCYYCGGWTWHERMGEGPNAYQASPNFCRDCESYDFFEYDTDTDFKSLSEEEKESRWVKGPKLTDELLLEKEMKMKKLLKFRKYQYSRLENVD